LSAQRGTGTIARMTTLAALWLPILAAAVAVFIVSSIIHMVLPIHASDYRKLPDEESVLDAMRRTGVQPGQFMFPCPASMQDMATPEMQAKFQRGPVGSLIVRPSGPMRMGAALLQWFFYCILVGVFVAYLTGLATAPGAAASHVFRVTATVALLGYAFWSIHDSIWKGLAWSTTAKFVFDGVAYALVTGAVFAWLWPAAA
jgi:hypothetical protein